MKAKPMIKKRNTPKTVGFSESCRKFGAVSVVASFISTVFVPWAGPTRAEDIGLTLIDSFKVADKSEGFSEPSGLSLSNVDGYLWSVSDEAPKLHLLGVDGTLRSSLKIPTVSKSDLEGVASRRDGSVLMLQEADRSLVTVHPSDPIRATTVPLAALKGYAKVAEMLVGNPLKKGPEGITVDQETGRVFIVIEGQPRLLLILSSKIDEIIDSIPLTREAGFVSERADDDELDVSGLAWFASSSSLWILSDKGRQIFVYDLGTKTAQTIRLTYTKDGEQKEVKNPEGIALDEAKGLLYILTDDAKKSRLFVFELPKV